MGQSQSTDLFCDTEVSGDTDVLQTRGVGMKKGWNKAFKRIVAKADREVKEFERSWDATLQRLADEWNKVSDARDKEGR